MKKIISDFKEKSSFTLVKIVTVVLAAMTTAFFSSKISSFGSSVLVAGAVALISFTLNELYGYVLSKTGDTVLSKAQRAQEDTDRAHEDDDDEDVEVVSRGSSLESTHYVDKTPGKKVPLFRRLWVNTGFRYSVLFFVVAVTSLSVNMLIPKTVENVELHPVTQVEQKVTEEDKKQIIDEAVEEAQSKIPSKTVIVEKDAEQSSSPTPTATPTSTDYSNDIESLKKELESIKSENTELKSKVEALNSEVSRLKESKDVSTPSSSPAAQSSGDTGSR